MKFVYVHRIYEVAFDDSSDCIDIPHGELIMSVVKDEGELVCGVARTTPDVIEQFHRMGWTTTARLSVNAEHTRPVEPDVAAQMEALVALRGADKPLIVGDDA